MALWLFALYSLPLIYFLFSILIYLFFILTYYYLPLAYFLMRLLYWLSWYLLLICALWSLVGLRGFPLVALALSSFIHRVPAPSVLPFIGYDIELVLRLACRVIIDLIFVLRYYWFLYSGFYSRFWLLFYCQCAFMVTICLFAFWSFLLVICLFCFILIRLSLLGLILYFSCSLGCPSLSGLDIPIVFLCHLSCWLSWTSFVADDLMCAPIDCPQPLLICLTPFDLYWLLCFDWLGLIFVICVLWDLIPRSFLVPLTHSLSRFFDCLDFHCDFICLSSLIPYFLLSWLYFLWFSSFVPLLLRSCFL